MVRVRSVIARHKRKKLIVKQAKGQFGHRSKRFRQAKKSIIKGLTYQYRDRKVKKGEFRSLWVIRLNAACREAGITYSRFIKGLIEAKVEINRKLLADLAVNSKDAFGKLIEIAKATQN